MNLVIGFLTVVLVLDCVLLGLLILIQLPKKEAGLGQAFGGGATDALFGAGSGNVLTKLTKYGAGIFFVLALTLSILGSHQSKKSGAEFEEKVKTGLPPAAGLPAAIPPGRNFAVPTNVPLTTPPVASTAAAPIFKPPTNSTAPAPSPAAPTTPPPQPK